MSSKLRTREFWQYSPWVLGLYAVIFLPTGSSVAAPVAKLNNWHFHPEAMELEIHLSAKTTPEYFYLAQPPRLVVDLPNTKLGYVPTIQNYVGAIQRIRVAQLNEAVTRIVLDLAADKSVDFHQAQLQPSSPQNSTRWVLRPRITSYTPLTQGENFQSLPNPWPSSRLQLPNTLEVTNFNPQQPFVRVPPLNPRHGSQLPDSIVPPVTVPQPTNLNSIPPGTNPNFLVPLVPDYEPNVSNIKVIEFGQPLPKPN
ncbi:N-acetylmuramoyl-L-alanine amidase (Uncharacterized protein) [Umezakia ovalisporum]|jgi:hypothetical protein|uniref:AMIN domain-containing protein n=1 Tax=Umezakia ovalisporum TaxID=75695 RepID=UPI0006F17E38|nr:N-acetylmuramoyl-L-alanine amidase (Uncharacterized protein) [Umezakia ovalisporum]